MVRDYKIQLASQVEGIALATFARPCRSTEHAVETARGIMRRWNECMVDWPNKTADGYVVWDDFGHCVAHG